MKPAFVFLISLYLSCGAPSGQKETPGSGLSSGVSTSLSDPQEPPVPIAPCDGFDFPVGPPNAKGYYNAQPFARNHHLGDDWNGTGGGNSDYGDPVYSVADGYVSESQEKGEGWGNVIRIIHNTGSTSKPRYVESLYAHLDKRIAEKGSKVRRGQKIGTIGNAHGAYYAHLHLEIRTQAYLPLGGGYDTDTTGFTNPTRFIKSHRPKR